MGSSKSRNKTKKAGEGSGDKGALGVEDFEGAISELEEIVEKLNESDLPLAELIAKYKRGAELVRGCTDILNMARKEIEVAQSDGEGGVRLSSMEIGNVTEEE